ncbi:MULTISPECIES: bifunctional 3-phenylpropionate/cinnamic acid dioxygenase ferredoxin subunit [unclassified Streptomyces]|uniref:bifunctional 3-phenylpropionate/cinnamic acid dioxygenase ferredoxin subunit n=1 Tax=unclassified Streptomyces TaxID=2593676 RepID=UPI002E2C0D98|nr:bifunctional 3-phenylpropionate/cinnamic acid dioxygenase ferredoxin subunit [Streptomyces sp. NBC_01429]
MFPVCRLEDLPEGEAVRIDTEPPIAVINADGELYAIDDTCTHQDASLSEGWIENCQVECPLHGAAFDLRTGRATCPPAHVPVRTHRVEVVDGVIHVLTGAPAPAVAGAVGAAGVAALGEGGIG